MRAESVENENRFAPLFLSVSRSIINHEIFTKTTQTIFLFLRRLCAHSTDTHVHVCINENAGAGIRFNLKMLK